MKANGPAAFDEDEAPTRGEECRADFMVHAVRRRLRVGSPAERAGMLQTINLALQYQEEEDACEPQEVAYEPVQEAGGEVVARELVYTVRDDDNAAGVISSGVRPAADAPPTTREKAVPKTGPPCQAALSIQVAG